MKKRKDGRYCLKRVIDDKTVFIYGDTEAEVWKKLDALLNEKAAPKTFGYYADLWKRYHSEEVTITTWQKNYKPSLDKLAPLFDIEIEKLTAPDLMQIMQQAAYQHYSRKVIGRIRSTASMIIDTAIANGEKIINFTPALKIPKAAAEAETREALTAEEMQIVLSSNELYPVLLLTTGLRRGEAMSLRGKDIDLQNGVISVNHSFEYVGNNPHIKDTKTKAGTRTVPIIDALRSLLPKKIKADEYLFGGATPWTQQKNRCYWKSFCKRFGLDVTQHQLRHSYATLLSWTDALSVKSIQTVMGHSDFRTTQNIYTHAKAQQELMPDVRNALNAFLSPKT